MRLTLVHGWGFDRHFWRPLMDALPRHQFTCVDAGYFGEPRDATHDQPGILIGHSLGFMLGMRTKHAWLGRIAVNSFPFFASRKDRDGCVPLAVLRAMKKQLAPNPQKTLGNFYRQIGATATPQGAPDVLRLAAGLDLLEHEDIRPLLATSSLPQLVLAGAQDPLVPVSVSEKLKTDQGAIHLHSTGGHCLPQSETAWCAEKIDRFLMTHFSDS